MKPLHNTFFHSLLDPHPRITDKENIQRTRLLSAILLVLSGLIVTIVWLVLHTDPDDITEPTVQGAIALVGIYVFMYLLNKAGYARLAATGIILPFIALFVYIPFYSGEAPIFLAFLMIPILLMAIFYPARWTAVLSILLLGGLFLLISQEDQFSDNSSFWNLRNLWYFLIIGTGLLLTFINHTHTLENIRQENLKQINTQLQESEARLRSLVENSPDFILEIDRDGNIVFINRSFDRYYGKNIRELIPPDQQENAWQVLEKAFQTGDPQAIELQLFDDTNSLIWCSARLGPVKHEGIVRYLTVILTDFTVQKEAQEQIQNLNKSLEARVAERTLQLETANRDLEAFSYSVSHDLRSPLRGISGFAQLLKTEYAAQLDETGQRFLVRILENAEQMDRLIDGLLQFSRLGRKNIQKQTVALGTLVQQVWADLEPERAGRQVLFSLAEDFPPCEADPILLRQVFFNLLHNAIKYSRTRDQACIEVNWHTQDGNGEKVVYWVQDNGAGFNMQYADKLFSVFQRLHRQDEFEGTGVGLATVHRILQKHGGHIWVEAQEHQGATFYFTV